MEIPKRAVLLLLPAFIFSCRSTVPVAAEGEKDILYTCVSIDTIHVDMENSSYAGFSGVNNGEYYFFDEFFNYYYPVSIDGVPGTRSMGLGRGPNELPIRSPVGVVARGEDFMVMGGSYAAYLFNESHNPNPQRLNIKVSGQKNSYDASSAYTLFREVVMRASDKTFFYNILGSNDAVDPIEKYDYFENGHFLMRVDIESGEALPMGEYSDYYIKNYADIRHMIMTYYDVDKKGNLYVCHQADSLIYVSDRKFKPVKAFGFEGKNMDTDYTNPSPSTADFERAYINDLAHKGYYYWLEYVDETDMTFRSYQKGSHSDRDGLQIYRGATLIADVEVPKGFRVAGYIAPYYVTQIICDEDNETMKFYRFRLD